jgi:hypothetical protein
MVIVATVAAMRRAVLCFVLATVLLAPFIEPAAANERRVGLVIGNQDYSSAQPLKTPVEDARLIAKTLRTIGFAGVIEHFNLN